MKKNIKSTKNLFSFEKKEIDLTFEAAQPKASISGLKLLQSPIKKSEEPFNSTDPKFGKLLIITSRKTGKACKRNKIRRQLKSIFYENKLFEKPVNSIILVYKQALDLKFDQLKEFLLKNI